MKSLQHADGLPQNPSLFLNTIMARNGLKNDAALSRFLKLAAPQISKMRNNRMAVSASTLLQIHDRTEMPIADLRTLLFSPTS